MNIDLSLKFKDRFQPFVTPPWCVLLTRVSHLILLSSSWIPGSSLIGQLKQAKLGLSKRCLLKMLHIKHWCVG